MFSLLSGISATIKRGAALSDDPHYHYSTPWSVCTSVIEALQVLLVLDGAEDEAIVHLCVDLVVGLHVDHAELPVHVEALSCGIGVNAVVTSPPRAPEREHEAQAEAEDSDVHVAVGHLTLSCYDTRVGVVKRRAAPKDDPTHTSYLNLILFILTMLVVMSENTDAVP